MILKNFLNKYKILKILALKLLILLEIQHLGKITFVINAKNYIMTINYNNIKMLKTVS